MELIVSISCISYNQKQFIRTCIENILAQKTTFSIELVIHDDASTDGTKEIIEEYRNQYPDIIFPYFQTENQYIKGVRGFMAKYNFPRCRGKYIALCEGDDYWTDPFKLQKQIDFLEANPEYSGCYHDTMVHYTNIDKQNHLFRDNLPMSMNAEDTISLFAPFHTSSFVFKKDCFTFQPFLRKVKSGDMAIFSIVSSKGLLGKVDGVMSVYRKHEGGITNSPTHNSTFHKDRILLTKYLNRFHRFKYRGKANQIIAIRKKIIKEERIKKSILLNVVRRLFWTSKRRIKNSLNKMKTAK